MLEEYEKNKRKQVGHMKSLMDYGMGALILIIGAFFLFRSFLGKTSFNERFPVDAKDYVLGSLMLLYGLWRIYRGYKKNYFR